ncbi:MAG: DsbA family protein [Candidatus Eremiobacteraeota bacterium]|nr:DsbA family protein [Candidatus Eremiobacteraeota bacterium]
MVHVTYYMDVLSSWCFIAEDAVDAVRREFGDKLRLDWRIAQLNDGGPIDATVEKQFWWYRRTNHVTGTQLNAAWREGLNDSTFEPNLVAEAARTLGIVDDSVRRALSNAGLREGRHVQHRYISVQIASQVTGIPVERFGTAIGDYKTLERLMESTIAFRALPVEMVPTFVISNDVGDRAVLSGLYGVEALAGVIREMEHASARYEEFMAKEPEPA